MRKSFLAVVFAVLLTANAAAQEAYDYEIDDPYVATVVGTPVEQLADLSPNFEMDGHRFERSSPKELPDVFWYGDGMFYAEKLQDGPAPLAFVISGTGGSAREGKVKLLSHILYDLGAHVIALPSPTHADFMLGASTNAMPGDTKTDVGDLYRVMKSLRDKVAEDREITGYFLTGYSLGALHTGFLAELDSREGAFNFDRALMLNPPISLYESALKLDATLLEGLPQGAKYVDVFWEEFMKDFSAYYSTVDRLDLAGDFLYDIYKSANRKPKEERVKFLIGWAFRLSASTITFTADVMNKLGYVVPPQVELGVTSNLTEYYKVTQRLAFRDYIDDMFVPFVQSREPDASRESIIEAASLRPILPFLAENQWIGLIGNADDIILKEGDVDLLKRTFGERATIYPNGGHLGNVYHRAVVDEIKRFFAFDKGDAS